MKKESFIKLIAISIFAVAMGLLECAIVIYLRMLYYPSGFSFPLKGFVGPQILGIEWVRELATIVMLVVIGFLAGKKIYEKFAYFLYAFAVWDIFYYVFLKLILNWPAGILDWDLLFLIPWPWAAPVLAPLLCAVLIIIASLFIIHFSDKGKNVRFERKEWLLLIFGTAVVLCSWLYDYGAIIFKGGFAKDFFSLTLNAKFLSLVESYVPQFFNWAIFSAGLILASIGVLMFYIRTKHQRKSN